MTLGLVFICRLFLLSSVQFFYFVSCSYYFIFLLLNTSWLCVKSVLLLFLVGDFLLFTNDHFVHDFVIFQIISIWNLWHHAVATAANMVSLPMICLAFAAQLCLWIPCIIVKYYIKWCYNSTKVLLQKLFLFVVRCLRPFHRRIYWGWCMLVG